MNRPQTVIAYINVAHALDHLMMLIFATAVLTMAVEFGVPFGDLLPLSLGGFIAFGALSLPAGWLGDRWSRRNMLAIFFIGGGLAVAATGLARNATELAIGLTAIGAFGAIYHPVGTAMLVSHAEKLGRDIGINGVWGNLGVAFSALITGALTQWFGWRAAFFIPGAVSIAAGIGFLSQVRDEKRLGSKAGGQARIGRDEMMRVFVILMCVAFSLGITFNAVTVALPKLIQERITLFGSAPAVVGAIGFIVYVCGAISQYTVGNLIDRYPLRTLFLPIGFAMTPLLLIASVAHDWAMLIAATGVVTIMYSQVTLNDAMTGKYTSDEWRARAFAARYTITFGVGACAVWLVAWLHRIGGFALTLQVLAALCVLIAIGALLFPRDREEPAGLPAE
ncbi:MFS transporter [Phreatobacter sp. AB_2022a]|uniref:MFS transporter n=1 Tax=Phreatobacter sp. AB_2022a TaxID=3003134 RepID=UPI002286D5B0|nr:MFS transporter [Phreatobacter sp. AB_2022a]MCZ0734443.1 MFS transporter [Phreatobacter sp. AB_2022a]